MGLMVEIVWFSDGIVDFCLILERKVEILTFKVTVIFLFVNKKYGQAENSWTTNIIHGFTEI